MIITEEKEQLHYLKKIIKEKRRHIYQIRSDGLLEYDGAYISKKNFWRMSTENGMVPGMADRVLQKACWI